MSTLERITWTVLVTAALAAVYFMPESVLRADLCVFKALTSVECPLCGMTRGMHLASRGDLAGAASLNPMGIVLVAVLLGTIPMLWLGRPSPAFLRILGVFLASGFLAGWVLRLIAA